MNLYLRMLFVVCKAFAREKIPTNKLTNSIFIRTMPNDLDLNLHVNNGRFLTLCDLSRIDLFVRTGLAKLMVKHKWSPIIAEHTMSYFRPLGLFAKVELVMSITHWDHKFFYCSHRFYVKEKLIAEGTSKALVVNAKGSLEPKFIIDAVDSSRK